MQTKGVRMSNSTDPARSGKRKILARTAALAVLTLFAGLLTVLSAGTASATPARSSTVAPAATATCHSQSGAYDCYAYTTGSTAHAGYYSSGVMYLYVCDTKADGDSPYVWYNIGSSTHQPTNRIEITTGNGTCSRVYTFGASEITMQACRDVPSNPDNCSPWDHVFAN